MAKSKYQDARKNKQMNKQKADIVDEDKKKAIDGIRKEVNFDKKKEDEIKREIADRSSLSDNSNNENKKNSSSKTKDKGVKFLENNEYYEFVDYINKLLNTKISPYSTSSVKKESLGISGSPFLIAFFKHFRNIECEKTQNKRAVSYSELAYSFIIKALKETKTLEKIVEETDDEFLKILFEKISLDIKDV